DMRSTFTSVRPSHGFTLPRKSASKSPRPTSKWSLNRSTTTCVVENPAASRAIKMQLVDLPLKQPSSRIGPAVVLPSEYNTDCSLTLSQPGITFVFSSNPESSAFESGGGGASGMLGIEVFRP